MFNLDLNTVALLVIAGLNVLTAIVTWRTNLTAKETRQIAQQTEHNTNSLSEQLVAATGKAAYAAGREEMRGEAEDKAAAVAQEANRKS
jgi:hypothetical protein